MENGIIQNLGVVSEDKSLLSDKFKMVPKGQGEVACGVLRRWFTDVSDVDAPGPAQAGGGVGRTRGNVAGQNTKAGS